MKRSLLLGAIVIAVIAGSRALIHEAGAEPDPAGAGGEIGERRANVSPAAFSTMPHDAIGPLSATNNRRLGAESRTKVGQLPKTVGSQRLLYGTFAFKANVPRAHESINRRVRYASCLRTV